MLRVAAIQMTSTPDREKNLQYAQEMIKKASYQGAQWVCFPENMALFASGKPLAQGGELLSGPTVKSLQSWAKEHRVWIHSGTLPLKKKLSDQKVTNSSLVIHPSGKIVARYDKIHLFDVKVKNDQNYLESKTIVPGKKVVTAQTPWGKVGLSVCYDIRFPELYRKMASQKPTLLFIPSAFTLKTGKAHWDILTRARAIENQAFVIAPAQYGTAYPGRQTYGHSRIISPWGDVLAEKKTGQGIVLADLDLEALKEIRKSLPALRHRKLKSL